MASFRVTFIGLHLYREIKFSTTLIGPVYYSNINNVSSSTGSSVMFNYISIQHSRLTYKAIYNIYNIVDSLYICLTAANRESCRPI